MGMPAKRRSWDTPAKSALPPGTLADAATTVALVDPAYAVRRAMQERREGAPLLHAESTMMTARVSIEDLSARRAVEDQKRDDFAGAEMLCSADTTPMVRRPVELLKRRPREAQDLDGRSISAPREDVSPFVVTREGRGPDTAPTASSDPTPLLRAPRESIRLNRLAVLGLAAMFCAANVLLACLVLF